MNSGREQNILLNHLDEPLRIMGIYKDEALALIVPIFIGFFSGWGIAGFICGISLVIALKSLKRRNEGASLIHTCYWYLPTSRKTMKLYIPSHIREYAG